MKERALIWLSWWIFVLTAILGAFAYGLVVPIRYYRNR
jgi:hypothetical protein